jgi:DNA primase
MKWLKNRIELHGKNIKIANKMKDPIKLKDLILEKLDISKLMLDDGVKFIYNPTGASEVQCHCPFHGKDTKPSARFYRSTNKCYCFKCKKAWNPVSYIMEKEEFNFVQAVNHLINRYNIDTSSVSDDPEFKLTKSNKISDIDSEIIRIKDKIRDQRGKIPFERYKTLCFAYYAIYFKMSKGENIIKDIEKLKLKI